MADEATTQSQPFDPDAFMKSRGFDPDAFMAGRGGQPPQESHLDWSKVIQNLPQSALNFWKNINKGLGPSGYTSDQSPEYWKAVESGDEATANKLYQKPAPGIFSKAHPDFADKNPHIASALDTVAEIAHTVTHPQESFEKDPVGTANLYGNLVRGGIGAAEAVAPEAAETVRTAVGGGTTAAKAAATAPVKTPAIWVRGVRLQAETPLPASGAGAIAGGLIGHYAGPLGMATGAAVGAAIPAVRGFVRGAREALANLAEKRAAAAQAAQDADAAARDAAITFKAGLPASSVEHTGTAGPPDYSQPVPIPPENQLLAPTSKPPIIAGPITPQEITGQDVTASNRPAEEAAATPTTTASAPAPQSGSTIATRDELAQGYFSKPYASLNAVDKSKIDALHDHLNAAPNDTTPLEERPTAQPLPDRWWETPSEKAAREAQEQKSAQTAQPASAPVETPAPTETVPPQAQNQAPVAVVVPETPKGPLTIQDIHPNIAEHARDEGLVYHATNIVNKINNLIAHAQESGMTSEDVQALKDDPIAERAFLDGAFESGRAAGRPIPKTKYQALRDRDYQYLTERLPKEADADLAAMQNALAGKPGAQRAAGQ